MSSVNETESPVVAADAPAVADVPAKTFISRDEWLNLSGHLKEEEHHIEGLGLLLLSEVSGDVRADIVANQSVGLLADQKKIDAKSYQRTLIQNGVVDPSSPAGARTAMFRPGDMERVMKLGGSKIAEIVDHIEKLSSLGQYSGSAEGNSEPTASEGSTS